MPTTKQNIGIWWNKRKHRITAYILTIAILITAYFSVPWEKIGRKNNPIGSIVITPKGKKWIADLKKDVEKWKDKFLSDSASRQKDSSYWKARLDSAIKANRADSAVFVKKYLANLRKKRLAARKKSKDHCGCHLVRKTVYSRGEPNN